MFDADDPIGTLAPISEWIFDLDNTLYPRHVDLFSQIDQRMTAYVSRLTGLEKPEARRLQKRLYGEYGTTLSGLMREYEIDPYDYLADVHAIDYGRLEKNPKLGDLLKALPGRKHIFTNADQAHAKNTLDALGIDISIFDSVFDIVGADFVPKPAKAPYERFVALTGIDPKKAIMFEDIARNLEVPKQMGMTTVLVVAPDTSGLNLEAFEIEGIGDQHIDHVTTDIEDFLGRLVQGRV